MHIALAVVLALGITAYWVFCRKQSLKHREKAANLIEAYLADDEVDEVNKNSIYWLYMGARHWAFMPAMALVTPIALAAMIATGGPTADQIKRSDRHNEIMDSIMKMYITRHPLTGTISLFATFFSIGMAAPIGMILNRMRTIPSVTMVYGSVASKASHDDLRHAH